MTTDLTVTATADRRTDALVHLMIPNAFPPNGLRGTAAFTCDRDGARGVWVPLTQRTLDPAKATCPVCLGGGLAATPSRLAIADDYYRVTLGVENTIYTVALTLTTSSRPRQVLGYILAIIPDAERVLLIDRVADLAVAWTNAHLDGDEAAMEAASAALYRVCRATARVVAGGSADAVAAYREVFEPAGGAS